jgi:hypothetical protein
MKKLLSILGATFALPLLVHAELQPPTSSPTQNDTQTQASVPKVGSKSPETAQKSESKDEKAVDDSIVSDDSPVNPVIPPTNNLNDASPGP